MRGRKECVTVLNLMILVQQILNRCKYIKIEDQEMILIILW